MPEHDFAARVATSAAHLPATSLPKERDMPIRLQSIVFCIGMAALCQVAVAAGAAAEKSPAAQEHAERETRPGKQRNNAEKKPARLQSAPAVNSYQQDLATIGAQADAAAAACASLPGDNQQACRSQVNADRERATAAIRSKHEQGGAKN